MSESHNVAYVQNMHVRIVPVVAEGVSAFRVDAPIKAKGLQQTIVRSDTAPTSYAVLEAWLANHSGKGLKVEGTTVNLLAKLGILVPSDRAPKAVDFRTFLTNDCCTSDEECESRLPHVWVVNPNIRLETAADSLASAGRVWRKVAALGTDAIVWVTDPLRDMMLPYWLTEAEAMWVRELISGQTTQEQIPADVRGTFCTVGIVYEANAASEGHRRWDQVFEQARQSLSEKKYAVIRDLIPPIFVKSLSFYYEELLSQGYLLADGDSNRFILRNELLSVWLHKQITETIARAIPEAVTRSYSYVAAYLPGADLERHTDQIECEYTLSISLASATRSSAQNNWPLYLDSPVERQTISVSLAPGDGIIFKGREIPHFRLPLDGDSVASSLLFHYVPADRKIQT